MRLDRLTARAAIFALTALMAFLLLQLKNKAAIAHAARAPALPIGESAPSIALSSNWRLSMDFDRGPGKTGLADGWSEPEPGSGVWSLGRQAILTLPSAPSAGPLDVTMTVDPFIAPTRPLQRVRARIGSRTIGEWRLTKPGRTTLPLEVPADARAAGGDFQIVLELPDASAPAHTVEGATDPRQLAIKLSRIDISG